MYTDRLTEKALNLLSKLPQKKNYLAEELLSALKEADGISSYILGVIPNIRVPKSKQIDIEELFKESYYQALKLEHPYVGTEHILLGLLSLISSKDYPRVKLELIKLSMFPNSSNFFDKSKKFPIMEGYGENLSTRTSRNLDKPLIMRKEYQSMVSALMLKDNSNVLVIGENGVGKKTLIELLAREIVMLNVPSNLAGYQVIEFDLIGFLTGLLNKGGIDIGLGALTQELKDFGRVIISLKNFQNVFFTSASGFTVPMFYSMFKSAVELPNVKITATLNSGAYEKIIAENDHILRDFSIIELHEPDKHDTLKILESNALYLEDFHNVDIPSDVVKYVYERAKTITSDVKFPKKGIELIDHACSHLIFKKNRIPKSYQNMVDTSFNLVGQIDVSLGNRRYNEASRIKKKLLDLENKLVNKEEKIFTVRKHTLTVADVAETVDGFNTEIKGIEQDKTNFTKLSNLSRKIKTRLVGQDDAVDLVVKSLIRSRLGLRSKKRPLGNFLFLGPTGVGKTELAKVLSDEFYGQNSLIRLDMSDFSEKHTVARLVGAPPGYVGYGEGGELTTKIENKPDSLVLFDEIEKAHPDVLNILLQIMEEGELSDARGALFDFSKSVIVLTSNLGTNILHTKDIGFEDRYLDDKKIENKLRLNLKKILKPELLNRFDEVIVFKQLKQKDRERVINILIDEITETLKKQNITLSVGGDIKDYILKLGYSEEYGARALRRTLEKELLDRIAEYILNSKQKPKKIRIIVKNSNPLIMGDK